MFSHIADPHSDERTCCVDLGPQPPAVTPPPLTSLKRFASVWSDGGDDSPFARPTPQVGDTLFGFKLVRELGRGAFARVYLAHQEALAERPVALKVTLKRTREAERLARLQHTNVVPVYSVHDDGAVQVICMPYLGRNTLADLIRAADFSASQQAGRKSTSARAARATAVNSGSKSASKASRDSAGGASGSRAPTWSWEEAGAPPIVGDPRAVVQVLAQLAAGLAHAHERGILHLDIKPANVLLADGGEPMLFDFNLSFDAKQPDREHVGGTMPYMAIEQLLDMRDRGTGAIDARTDLYALGVTAYELLTGGVPFPSPAGARRSIDTLIALRRAGPPSVRDRNPAVSPAVEAIIRKLLAADPADRYQTADELRTDAERHLNDLPLQYARDGSLRERAGKWRRRNPRLPMRFAVAGLMAVSLTLGAVAHHRANAASRAEVAEQARLTHAALAPLRLDLVLPNDPKSRERGIKRATELLADWQKPDATHRLSEADRVALAGNLDELTILLARAKGEKPDAEGDDEPAAAAPPQALFLAATAKMSRRQYLAAVPLFERVIAADPAHAAAQFCLAFCRQHVGQFERAVERYDVAAALLPRDPRPAYQRGMIYHTVGKNAAAEAEFTKSLAHDPSQAVAFTRRAISRFMQGGDVKLTGAEADFADALKHGASPVYVHLLRARIRDARNDRTGAAADRAAAKGTPLTSDMDFVTRGWSRIEADPKAALADFQKAAEIQPDSMQALHNQANILSEHFNDHAAALVVINRLLEHYPVHAPAVAGKAVVLARLGRRKEAHDEIKHALALSDDPLIQYQAARVYAITSATHPEDRALALARLRDAYRHGFKDAHCLATDPDLKTLRDRPEFEDIRHAAKVLFR